MAVVSMRELLEAGVHFGHQTRRWNPKMKRFIFAERGGIYIIDLQQTSRCSRRPRLRRNLAERGGTILFVGTKKQAQDAIEEQAKRVGMPYVNHRWLGGLLTNWRTISDRIDRLHDLRRQKEDGQLDLLPAKERIAMLAELAKLDANLGGVADLAASPTRCSSSTCARSSSPCARRAGWTAGHRSRRHELRSRRVGLRDPGNDDAIRACSLIARVIADGIEAGKNKVSVQELAAPRCARADRRARAGSRAGAAAASAPGPTAAAEPEPEPGQQPEPTAAAAEVPADEEEAPAR
jgi:small subunit ribosomal protein S2